MAYTSGTALSAALLLEDLKDFLVTNGWTLDSWADDNSDYRSGTTDDSAVVVTTGNKRLHVHKTDAYGQVMYFNFRSAQGQAVFENSDDTSKTDDIYDFRLYGIAINGSTGAYSGALAWDKQSGHSANTLGESWGGCAWATTASMDYWIVQNGDTVVLIFEEENETYSYLVFGSLSKDGAGTYTGGQFFSASFSSYGPYYQRNHYTPHGHDHQFYTYCSNNNRYPYPTYDTAGAVFVNGPDSLTTWMADGSHAGDDKSTSEQTTALVWSGTGSHCPVSPSGYGDGYSAYCSIAYEGAPNLLASVTPMYPIYALAHHMTSHNERLLGSPEGIRHICMDAIANKTEFTISGDTWKCFPARHREGLTETEYGFIPGFAILIS